jgi:hypothetical protein
MYKKTLLILATISFLFIGCIKKHKFSVKACNGLFYVEVFNVNPAGVDEDYMTDSFNFKIFVGKTDSEHENFRYVCKGDSITVMKFVSQPIGNKMKMVALKILSYSELVKNKTNSNEPLFEFK